MTIKSLQINYSLLKKWTISYAALPLLIFTTGWLQPLIGILVSVLLIYAVYKCAFEEESKENLPLINNKKLLWGLVLIALVWCYLAGLGGFYYQSPDHHWRNAVFHDLIAYEWPVRYNSNDTALVYYIGFWLPSAVIAHLSTLLGANPDTAFTVGNIALLFYSTIGIVLLMLNLIYVLKVQSRKQIVAVIALLIFFSGLDILGNAPGSPFIGQHLEWWAYYFQYSSLTTDLFWVYNQAIIAWLMTLTFYIEQKEKNYALIVMLCLFCAPFPAIGLAAYMIVLAVNNFFKAVDDDKINEYFRNIFSVQNVIAAFVLLPISGAYLSSNAAVSDNGLRLVFDQSWPLQMIYLPLFWMLEFGIFAILIAPDYKENFIFRITVYSLLLFPLFLIGNGKDMAMRGSIPALMILMIMVGQYLLKNFKNKQKRLRIILLSTALLIGAITPATEFYRSFKTVAKSRTVFLRADQVKTFEGSIYLVPGTTFPVNGNFGTFNASDKFFYRFLANNPF